ncbi:thioredoxin domain-containing protein [Phytomonospora sp. NPDC050363]|uniref:DsbA family protein n=1 Tax=Phytomonospora sp. NPDC050363 TaxID=3155642 RepID=UPI0033F3C9CC
MTDPQWQQQGQPYPQYGQEPPPQGQPGPQWGQQPPAQGQPQAGGWPAQPPPPGYQPQPGYPPGPQQGFPGQPGWPAGPGLPPAAPKRTGLIVGAVVGAVVLVAALIIGGVALWSGGADERSGGGGAPTAAVEGHGVVVGEGPVKVEIWLDFQCPPCGEFHANAGKTLREFTAANRITVVYHPLNFLDSMSTDEYSTRAASASVCAADQGEFEAYADFLFTSRPVEGGPGLSDEELVQGGTPIGLADPFADCVRTTKYADWVETGTTESGVGAVPTATIGGSPVADMTNFVTALEAAA